MPIQYIQLNTATREIVYLELGTGDLCWLLPERKHMQFVRFLSYIDEDSNKQYFEEITDQLQNPVTWELPVKYMIPKVRYLAETIIKSKRKVVEDFVGSKYNEKLSQQQTIFFDEYLLQVDALKRQGKTDFSHLLEDDSDVEDNEEDGREIVFHTAEALRKYTIKSGYLSKLATVSGRNWKRRFFTITPYHLSYYVDESANQKPKGTIVITPDARVEEDKSDKRHGFSFKYISKDENITLAAVSELDRTHWMQTIESVIKISARYLKEYVTILPDSTVLHTNAKNAFGMKIAPPKNAIRKYCILADEVITIHPDKEGITIIDAVLNVNCKSTLVGTNDNDRTITVTDSDPKQTRMTMQFVANHDYQTWKQAITRFIKGEEEKPKADNRNSQKANPTPTPAPTQAPAPVPPPSNKLPIGNTSNFGVFGLDAADDDDDEDDFTSNPVSNVPFGQSNKPFNNTSIAGVFGIGSLDDDDDDDDSPQPVVPPPPKVEDKPAESSAKKSGKALMRFKAKQRSITKTNSNIGDIKEDKKAQDNLGDDNGDDDDGEDQDNSRQQSTNPIVAAQAASSVPFGGANSFLMNAVSDDDDDDYNHNNAISNPVKVPAPEPEREPEPEPEEVKHNPIARRRQSMAPPTDSKGPDTKQNQHPVESEDPVPPVQQSPPIARRRQSMPPSNPAPDASVSPSASASSAASAFSKLFNNDGDENAIASRASSYVPFQEAPIVQSAVPFQSGVFGEDHSDRYLHHDVDTHATGNGVPPPPPPPPLVHRPAPVYTTTGPSLSSYLNAPIEMQSSNLLDQILMRPTQDFLLDTKGIVHECEYRLQQLISQNNTVLLQSNRNQYKTTLSYETIESYLRSSLQQQQNMYANPQGQNGYQQLLQEKEQIFRLLQHVREAEDIAIKRIQEEEMQTMQRMQREAQNYQKQLSLAQEEIKNMSKKHEDELNKRIDLISQAKDYLFSQEKTLQQTLHDRMKDLTSIAKDLSQQFLHLQQEKKKVLKQRYTLDIALNDMNIYGTLPPVTQYPPEPQMPSQGYPYQGYGRQPPPYGTSSSSAYPPDAYHNRSPSPNSMRRPGNTGKPSHLAVNQIPPYYQNGYDSPHSRNSRATSPAYSVRPGLRSSNQGYSNQPHPGEEEYYGGDQSYQAMHLDEMRSSRSRSPLPQHAHQPQVVGQRGPSNQLYPPRTTNLPAANHLQPQQQQQYAMQPNGPYYRR